ncbi:MAG: hypothetical protein WAW92_03030 [Minisyncoccia bacterium]
MGVDLSRTSHVIFFAGVIPALSLVLAWLFSQLIPTPPFWLETLSPLLAYAFIYTLFEKYLWTWKIFRILGITVFPDLRGRWCGKQQSTYNNTITEACLEIKQTFSNVSVCAHYQKSNSGSVVANFVEINGDKWLFYTYDSEPGSLKQGTMQMHKGTAKIKYVPSDKKLIGFYFNSIGNQGDMDFNFDGHKLLGRFAK